MFGFNFWPLIGKLLWMSQLRDVIKFPVKELSRSLINPQDVDFDNLIHLLKHVNQTRDYVYVMEPHIPTAGSQGFIPVEVVSYSDSDWAGCQRSRTSTSGSLITLFSVNLSSTSRTQASVSHSSAEAELYAMTQAAVDSLAIKALHQGTQISDSFKRSERKAGKTMASRLGISKKSKHIELRRLWIQDILSEGVMSLEKVGTHHNLSDVLTKFVQSSVLGNHLPKLNLFKDSSLAQVFKVSSIAQVQGFHRDHRGSHVEDQRLARLHQVCAQHQGQVCMINFEALQDQQDVMIQRFRSASSRIRRAFTPPPPRRMHFVVQGYQFSAVMLKKVKQITVMLVNVNQVSVTIFAIINQRRTGSRKESLKTDETFKTSVSLYLHPVQCSIRYMYFHCVSFHVIQPIIISIILLDSRLKLSRVIPLSSIASVVNFSCHIHLQNGSSTSTFSSGQCGQ